MFEILDKINKANDIKKVNEKEYKKLAKEIRGLLIRTVSKTGGHLASNLGVVELTMALHLFMNLPEDKLIWDVGHQSYVHKILTGRKDKLNTLRQYKGISGFPRSEESDCDTFDTGHSSTSISTALGLAKARDLNKGKEKIVAVLGDGALTGGMAYEALNNAGRLKSNLIIVLNDNNMSISENVGGMANYLARLRTSPRYTGFKENMEHAITEKIPNSGKTIVDVMKRAKDSVKYLMLPSMIFEDMGLTYIGPIDGHNIKHMSDALYAASKVNKAVVVHVVTKKGLGYKPAEKKPSKFHGVGTFNVSDGTTIDNNNNETYTAVFEEKIVELASKDHKIVTISAAMPCGTGLSKFKKQYPDRFFDVGIAEEHAVAFAAGLAKGGFKPVVAIYSTFLQRAYDQIIHDVCINNLPVVFAIDRAGITGRDGKTHQGIYDLSYLSHIPNLTVMAPKNKWELEDMLEYALSCQGPVAIRYPRGEAYRGLEDKQEPIEQGKSEVIYEDGDLAILAVGNMVKIGEEVALKLKEQGRRVTLVNVRFVTPLDIELLDRLGTSHNVFVTMEENVRSGGFGQKVSDYICEKNIKTLNHINISIPDMYVDHGSITELHNELGINADAIVKKILEEI